jgi:hypothetical protein|tara:strand:+ start:165 stop:407 length:243 start_codon:yes stop_codon:yes gene_type:complete
LLAAAVVALTGPHIHTMLAAILGFMSETLICLLPEAAWVQERTVKQIVSFTLLLLRTGVAAAAVPMPVMLAATVDQESLL